jgi:hypothetical protein
VPDPDGNLNLAVVQFGWGCPDPVVLSYADHFWWRQADDPDVLARTALALRDPSSHPNPNPNPE